MAMSPATLEMVAASNNKSLGDIAELAFQYTAHVMGYKTAKPFGDNNFYDVVLENKNKKLLKVQIKSLSYKRGTRYKTTFKCGTRRRFNYTPDDVDVMACFFPTENKWHFINWHTNKLTCLTFSFQGSKPVDNWEVFDTL